MKQRSLHELRLWLVGERLAVSLAPACEVEVLCPGGWKVRAEADLPAFLLVEATEGVGEVWGGELDDLIERCEHAGVPRLLWIAMSPLDSYWLNRCGQFNRVFSMDRGQVPELEAAGAPAPWALWPDGAAARRASGS